MSGVDVEVEKSEIDEQQRKRLKEEASEGGGR